MRIREIKMSDESTPSHLDYYLLNVGTATQETVDMLATYGPVVWTPLSLNYGSYDMCWDVMYTKIDGVQYFKTIEQYKNYEFEVVFGFKDDTDFVSGRVIYVRPGDKTRVK